MPSFAEALHRVPKLLLCLALTCLLLGWVIPLWICFADTLALNRELEYAGISSFSISRNAQLLGLTAAVWFIAAGAVLTWFGYRTEVFGLWSDGDRRGFPVQ